MKILTTLILGLVFAGAASARDIDDDALLARSVENIGVLTDRQAEALAQLIANCFVVPKSQWLSEPCTAASRYFAIVGPDAGSLFSLKVAYLTAVRDLGATETPRDHYEKKLWRVTQIEIEWGKALRKRFLREGR